MKIEYPTDSIHLGIIVDSVVLDQEDYIPFIESQPPAQLDYLDYFLWLWTRRKSFVIWWTRGDSNPRPPRCEQWGK